MGDKKEKKQYSVISTDYHLLEEIGQGSTGTVYRAVCLPFNEVVAIKKLDLEKCCGNLDDVRREAQTMVLINHPNVVRAFCSFVVSQHLWVVMPYMGGGSCLHIMKVSFPDGFEEQIIATILKECLKALEYLHRQGHIHRDVKAGNILIDENGATKLGDFGVAACMFESGDRKWSRNTFVGTPCWMAPEVMEQLNGYDFKADIWSFGITALELAHGHAPFSKYPPMKVLLMTLQNAPPGLSYARDKKYSKAFKELIAMCLVKDPTKRPTAEKLLKHSFFKSAKSNEYIYRHLFEGLPPLWERVRNLKLKEASRLAEKKVPYEEQEERSQNEYKRGVSGWNFDVEDLKAQAALIQDDYAPTLKKEDDEQAKFCALEADGFHSLESIKLENIPEVIEVRSVPVAMQPKLANAHKHESPCNTDFEESELSDSPTCLDQKKAEKQEQDNNDQLLKQDGVKKYLELEHQQDELKTNEVRSNDNEREEHHEINFSVSLPSVDEKEKDLRQVGRPGDESSRVSTQQDKLPNGSVPDHRPANGSTGLSRIPSGLSGKEEDKSKGHVVQKKGRFSVTSADVNLKENSLPQANLRRATSAQGLVNQSGMAQTPSPVSLVASTASNVSVPAVLSHLQSLLNHTSMQQDTILNLMISVSTGENPTGQKLSHSRSMPPEHSIECWSDRERELRHQVAELQGRVVLLVDELQVVKLRNVQLERQLNAIFNKEEEERIRKEEAAREDS